MRDTLNADLQAALDGLPAAFREVVWLRDVDELSYQDAAAVAAHLPGCPACQRSAEAQASIRRVLQSRAAELSPMAPPGLRTRIAAVAQDARSEAAGILNWGGRGG